MNPKTGILKNSRFTVKAFKNVLLATSLTFASGLTYANWNSEINGLMQDLDAYFSQYKDYKSLSGNQAMFYSPSSIQTGEHKEPKLDWETKEITYDIYPIHSVIIKTVSKGGYAVETLRFDCRNKTSTVRSRLYYGHDHKVLPARQQQLIVGQQHPVKFGEDTPFGKFNQTQCQKLGG